MSDTTTYDPSEYHLTKLSAWIRKFDRWMRYCEAVGNGESPKRPAMPSKPSKHYAYGNGHSLVRHFGLTREDGTPIHPMNVDDLRLIVALSTQRRGA